MTGLSRAGIFKNLASLVERGLISKTNDRTVVGDNEITEYTIIVYSVGGGGIQSDPPVLNSVAYGVCNSVDPQKKDITKETTTTATVAAVAVSESEKEVQIIEKLADHLNLHSQEFGRDWALNASLLQSLAKSHGLFFLIDQVNYMIAKQQRALKDEQTMKKKKTNKIDNPVSFLRMACEKNWGMSEKAGR
jgi:hypothetical protein